MICLDKPTLLSLMGNGVVIALYSFAMIAVGVSLTLFFIVLHKTGYRVKRFIDAFIWLVRNWKKVREWW